MDEADPSGEACVELSNETLRVESKLYFLDLRRNARGTFCKIAEKGAHRERSTVIVPAAAIPYFCALLEYYAGTGEGRDRAVESKQLPVESKVFFFEVRSNARGRYLRISESGAGPRGRSSIIIPSAGPDNPAWLEMRARLDQLELLAAALQDGVSVAGPVVGPGPGPANLLETATGGVIRAGDKRFFFDLGNNQKGHFLRITEVGPPSQVVVGTDRISIVVPTNALNCFGDAVSLCQRLTHGHGPGATGSPTNGSLAAGSPPRAPPQQPFYPGAMPPPAAPPRPFLGAAQGFAAPPAMPDFRQAGFYPAAPLPPPAARPLYPARPLDLPALHPPFFARPPAMLQPGPAARPYAPDSGRASPGGQDRRKLG